MADKLYPNLDEIYLQFDKKHIRRTKNIRLIPSYLNRRGGKLSYAEWAHVIGIFQSVIYQNVVKKTGNHILDIGCGTGLLGISSEPYTYGEGSYTGIDVMENDVAFCKKHYQSLPNYKYIHFDVANPTYARSQDKTLKPWPIADNSKDLVTALSVWTHLCKKDAIFYFKEIFRVLKNKGRAIVTFFYLDEKYRESLSIREDEMGRFHSTNQMDWIFEKNAYESENWYTPKWTKHPEDAIGVKEEALNIMTKESGLNQVNYYPGNWKENPGLFFQDILIFEK